MRSTWISAGRRRGLVHRLTVAHGEASALGAGLDWKTSLQELGASTGAGVPRYEVTSTGPDHARHFSAVVHVGDAIRGEGAGASKKVAEQLAAASAYAALQRRRRS